MLQSGLNHSVTARKSSTEMHKADSMSCKYQTTEHLKEVKTRPKGYNKTPAEVLLKCSFIFTRKNYLIPGLPPLHAPFKKPAHEAEEKSAISCRQTNCKQEEASWFAAALPPHSLDANH